MVSNGTVERMVPSVISLVERIRKELVEPVTKKLSSEATTQTPAPTPPDRPSPSHLEDDRRDPLRVPVGVGGPAVPRMEYVLFTVQCLSDFRSSENTIIFKFEFNPSAFSMRITFNLWISDIL